MKGKVITGMLLGAAVTMMMVPEMDRGTRKRLKRAQRTMRHSAMDAYDSMMRYMR